MLLLIGNRLIKHACIIHHISQKPTNNQIVSNHKYQIIIITIIIVMIMIIVIMS